MPKILISKWIEFFIFSGDIKESRKHVHIASRKGKRRQIAKFWLEPNIEVAEIGGFTNKELKEIEKVIIDNFSDLIKQINKFFSGDKIDIIEV
jgi:hypothetical protein